MNQNTAGIVSDYPKRVYEKVMLTDRIITNLSQKMQSPGLFTGLAGIALYKAILYNCFEKEETMDELESCLHGIFDALESGEATDCSWCSGLTGMGIALYGIDKMNILGLDSQSIIGECIPFVYNAMEQAMDSNNFDFLYGGTGLALFLLKFNEQHLHDEILTMTR